MNWEEYAALRDATCALDGCERAPARIGGRYCETHARRVRRTGSPGPAAIRRYTKKPRRSESHGAR